MQARTQTQTQTQERRMEESEPGVAEIGLPEEASVDSITRGRVVAAVVVVWDIGGSRWRWRCERMRKKKKKKMSSRGRAVVVVGSPPPVRTQRGSNGLYFAVLRAGKINKYINGHLAKCNSQHAIGLDWIGNAYVPGPGTSRSSCRSIEHADADI